MTDVTTTCQCGCGTAVDTAPASQQSGTCSCGCGTAAETPVETPKSDRVPTGACGCTTEGAGAPAEGGEACTCGCCDPVPA